MRNKVNLSFALYDAFSETPFGGSQAAIITGATEITRETRLCIARELGMPATAFVDARGDDWIQVQFMSAVMELPMCGHGTVCLLTHMFDSGEFCIEGETPRTLTLRLTESSALVEVAQLPNDRFQVMLDINPPTIKPAPRAGDLLLALGLGVDALDDDLPIEIVCGDFIHLVIPLSGLEAMRAIKPDFDAIVACCHSHDIDTVAVFSHEVEMPCSMIHVRDFCPAVGVAESAAAGTTNAALSSYLYRHGLTQLDGNTAIVRAEQGIELGRPSSIQSKLTIEGGEIVRLQVGGVATKVLDGQIHL